MARKRTPPLFLKSRKIVNERFNRHDSISLAEDLFVMNFDVERCEELEPLANALEWVKDNSKSQNEKLGNDESRS